MGKDFANTLWYFSVSPADWTVYKVTIGQAWEKHFTKVNNNEVKLDPGFENISAGWAGPVLTCHNTDAPGTP